MLLAAALCLLSTQGLILQQAVSPMRSASPMRCSSPGMGFFDLFKESEAAKAAKEAEYRAMQEMLERRRNPAKMAAYEAEVERRREEISAKDAELKELQKTGDYAAWQKMREEGKLQASDDMVREAGDRSWGGVGLVAERIDTKLPFIDSGYVDESQPDLMGGLKKLFGGDKKDGK